MAVAFRSESHLIATDTATAPDPGTPAGAANGDVLVTMGLIDKAASTWTIPTGWTSLYSGSSNANFTVKVAWIARGGSAPATAWAKNNASLSYEIYILSISGGNNVALDSQSASGSFAVSGGNPHSPATVAVNAACLAICGGVGWAGSGAGGWTAPTSYTMRSNNVAGNDGALATRLLSSSGTETPGAFANIANTNSDIWNGFTITIAPPAAGGGFPPFAPGPRADVFWGDNWDTGRISRRMLQGMEQRSGFFPTDLRGRGFLDSARPLSRAARRHFRKARELWRSTS